MKSINMSFGMITKYRSFFWKTKNRVYLVGLPSTLSERPRQCDRSEVKQLILRISHEIQTKSSRFHEICMKSAEFHEIRNEIRDVSFCVMKNEKPNMGVIINGKLSFVKCRIRLISWNLADFICVFHEIGLKLVKSGRFRYRYHEIRWISWYQEDFTWNPQTASFVTGCAVLHSFQ